MPTIAHLAQTMQTLLTTDADDLAHRSAFIQRNRQVSGAAFVQGLVFGWLAHPQARLSELAAAVSSCGSPVSVSGLDQRFTPRAADFLQALLERAVQTVVETDPVAIPLLQRFGHVQIQDSTTIVLPDALRAVWAGCGGSSTLHTQAALKLQERLDLVTGRLEGPELLDGRTNDKASALHKTPLPAGTLWIADLGFFALGHLATLEQQDCWWLMRVQATVTVTRADGQPGTLQDLLPHAVGETVDVAVRLGREQPLPCRLLAVRVPQAVAHQRRMKLLQEAREKGAPVPEARLALVDWTIYVTNVPADKLTVAEALVLARVRWQIELLHKLWKSVGEIDTWRSGRPWRILGEVYAKLLGMVIQHWLLLVSCWDCPTRSWVIAAGVIRQHAMGLAMAANDVTQLAAVIERLRVGVRQVCRITTRRTEPSTAQRLLALAQDHQNTS